MIEGSCHCGAVRWQLDATPEGATACNCTVCRRYGVLWAYDWDGEGIRVCGPTRAYVRGEREIEFPFCPTCGWVLGRSIALRLRRARCRARGRGRGWPISSMSPGPGLNGRPS
nr:hypothetical protein [Caldimonas sp.]